MKTMYQDTSMCWRLLGLARGYSFYS